MRLQNALPYLASRCALCDEYAFENAADIDYHLIFFHDIQRATYLLALKAAVLYERPFHYAESSHMIAKHFRGQGCLNFKDSKVFVKAMMRSFVKTYL